MRSSARTRGPARCWEPSSAVGVSCAASSAATTWATAATTSRSVAWPTGRAWCSSGRRAPFLHAAPAARSEPARHRHRAGVVAHLERERERGLEGALAPAQQVDGGGERHDAHGAVAGELQLERAQVVAKAAPRRGDDRERPAMAGELLLRHGHRPQDAVPVAEREDEGLLRRPDAVRHAAECEPEREPDAVAPATAGETEHDGARREHGGRGAEDRAARGAADHRGGAGELAGGVERRPPAAGPEGA